MPEGMFRPILGPYQVYQFSGPEPVEVVSIPFAEVVGGQICCRIADNLAGGPGQSLSQKVQTNTILAAAIVEVSIIGVVFGMETTLKCVAMRMITGPMIYQFGEGDAYQNIIIKARMLRGGVRSVPAADVIDSNPNDFNAGLGFGATMTIAVQSRLEFPKKVRSPCG